MQLTFSQIPIPRGRKKLIKKSVVTDSTAIEKTRHSPQMHK